MQFNECWQGFSDNFSPGLAKDIPNK